MLYYDKSPQTTLGALNTAESGLSEAGAAKRLKRYGLNVIKIKGEPLWRKLIEPFVNIFMLVLLAAAAISFLNKNTLDAIIISAIMAINAIIYYVQSFSTERIIKSLQKHTAQNVEVVRGGLSIEIDSSMLVPGDIITLHEGDKIPADGRLIDGDSVRVDESQLTGESSPVSKNTNTLTGHKEVYEQSNILFQGSFIVAGKAVLVIINTADQTEFGQLAMLTTNEQVISPVQKKIDQLINQIIIAVSCLALLAFGLALYRGTELTEAVRFVMALSVSAVPEGLPVAISVILILGMRRMAAKKALVRTMRAIETLGVLTSIATDKTGTLTKNKLTVQEVWQPDGVSQNLIQTIHLSINHGSRWTHDPLDSALETYVRLSKKVQSNNSPLVSLSFNQAFAMSGNLWHNGANFRFIVKGAPEHILAKSKLSVGELETAETELHRLTTKGYRVIALADTETAKRFVAFDDIPKSTKFKFVGFVAIADILRPEAKRAIAAANAAGVSVQMITGDHYETAYQIGRELSMVTSRDQVFDSRRMRTMSDKQLLKIINDVRIFSRVIPENKYRILSLLKQTNITAMTGDGVNDVPALTNADVGVAMGDGSQIAKDAGDIILLDNNFKSIIDAMHEGRVIFANIRRMLFYLLSTNAGEALTMVGALIIGLPIPLLPVQILWINLVTDSAMVIPLGLEPGEKTVMKLKPRRPDAPILSPFIISRVILVALTMAVTALILYSAFNNAYGHIYARTITFCALVIMQWANAFNARSDYQSAFTRLKIWNGKFYAGLTVAITLQIMAIFGPLKSVLGISNVAIGDLVITGTIAFIVPLALVELHKLIGRKLFHKGALKAHVF